MEPIEVSIERLVPGGVALGHHADGRVVLLKGPLPGDLVRVRSWTDRKGHIQGEAWDLVTPSVDRQTPRCPVAEECGGCDLMGLSAPAQKAAKLGLVTDALRRIGGFDPCPPVGWVGSTELGYRNRVRLHVAKGQLGYFRERTHELVTPPTCCVCEPDVDRALQRVTRATPPSAALFDQVEIRALSGRLDFVATPRAGVNAEALQGALAEWKPFGRLTWPGAPNAGGFEARLPLPDGLYTYVPPGGFVQVNTQINHALITAIRSGAVERGAQSFCDFYSGSSNFGIPLLHAGLRGVSVEGRKDSVEAAKRAATEQQLGGKFVSGEAATVARRMARNPANASRRFDLIVVDAPRAGARGLVQALGALSPRWVALCGCDPVTLARDLKELRTAGYELESVTAFDMFPQTHHVEVLAWLAQRSVSNVSDRSGSPPSRSSGPRRRA